MTVECPNHALALEETPGTHLGRNVWMIRYECPAFGCKTHIVAVGRPSKDGKLRIKAQKAKSR